MSVLLHDLYYFGISCNRLYPNVRPNHAFGNPTCANAPFSRINLPFPLLYGCKIFRKSKHLIPAIIPHQKPSPPSSVTPGFIPDYTTPAIHPPIPSPHIQLRNAGFYTRQIAPRSITPGFIPDYTTPAIHPPIPSPHIQLRNAGFYTRQIAPRSVTPGFTPDYTPSAPSRQVSRENH
jgi:hypothetical protein